MTQPARESTLSFFYNHPLNALNALDAVVTAGMLVVNPSEDTAARVLHLGSRVISSCVTHKSSSAWRIAALGANLVTLVVPSTSSDLSLLVNPTGVLRVILNGFGLYQDDKGQQVLSTILSAVNMANIGLPHRS